MSNDPRFKEHQVAAVGLGVPDLTVNLHADL